MKKTLVSLGLAATAIAQAAMPAFAVADANTINLQPGFWTSIEGMTIPSLVAGAIKLILIIAALIFFFMLVIGGIQWIASGGDKQGTEAAKNRITAALIGLVVVFTAWAIAALINRFFGINIFSLEIPKI